MNRQQRRQVERQAKKDAKGFRNILSNPLERSENEAVIRQSFREGQIYNNHEWAVRLERIADVKGIGPKLLDAIFRSLEEPINDNEKEKARQGYESGVEAIEIGNQKSN